MNRPGIADHAAPKESLMKRYRKAIVAALGLAATLVSAGVLDHTTEGVVNGTLAIATALGVWAVPNSPTPASPLHDGRA